MNIDVTVAHSADKGEAQEAFVYEDLDREASYEQLREEVYSDFETDYPGCAVDILELAGDVPKVLARVLPKDYERSSVGRVVA